MISLRARLSYVLFYAILIGAFCALLYGILVARNQATRGIWFPGDPLPAPSTAPAPLGTTVELSQYSEDELEQILSTADGMGVVWLRQTLPWEAIEPAPGKFEWEPWDRIVEAVGRHDFRLILVVNRTPEWARRPGEAGNGLAPPADPEHLARFAAAAAERYRGQVAAWQIWDEPNLMPHWGTEAIIDPQAYAELLAVVAPAIRAADREASVVTAGLAPTSEAGGYNMRETAFLQGLYDAGAASHFDAVALKPYGFWYGATERIYREDRLNFDRVVLAREVMVRNGDGTTPLWFVEGGWASLPEGWDGTPAPWGSDRPAVQQRRLRQALERTALEWPWVQVVALQLLQPDRPPDDPRHGLALLDRAGSLTALGETFTETGQRLYHDPVGEELRARWKEVGRPALRHFDYAAWLVLGMLLLLGVRLGQHTRHLPWRMWRARFRDRPEPVQIAAIAGVALTFYLVDHPGLFVPLYLLLGVLVAWRLDLGLAATAFAIPFFLRPKAIGALQFAMVELLLLLCLLAWLHRGVLEDRSAPLAARLRACFWPDDSLDWALVLFAGWAGISVFFAQHFGVAAREFRVVVLESVLWFWLIRRAGLSGEQRWRLLDALIVAVGLLGLYGLYQWLFTIGIIRAEGVHRVRAIYGSPNNLALILMRVLPIAAAVAVLGRGRSPRLLLNRVMVVPISLCLLLTFSRGALLLGLPAAALWLVYWGDRRLRWVVAAAAGVGVILLLPFVGTERVASMADLGGRTLLIRLHLWQATVGMIRDFPLVGVGLDNFLYLYDQYRHAAAWRDPDLSHPHQILLHFWVALGLPGLLFLCWQQWEFWRRLLPKIPTAPPASMARALLVGIGASMLSSLVYGMIDNSFFLVDLAYVWMLIIALIGTEDEEHYGPPDTGHVCTKNRGPGERSLDAHLPASRC